MAKEARLPKESSHMTDSLSLWSLLLYNKKKILSKLNSAFELFFFDIYYGLVHKHYMHIGSYLWAAYNKHILFCVKIPVPVKTSSFIYL